MKSKNEFTTNEEYNEYLRIYFAGLAMQGMLSNSEWRTTLDIETNTVERALIRDSIKYANELLKQLENEQ